MAKKNNRLIMHNDIKWNRTFLNLNTMYFKPPDINPDIFDKYKKINRLIIIGNGSEKEKLQKKASSNIEFKGFLEDKELENYKKKKYREKR